MSELIAERHSWRSYRREPLERDTRDLLRAAISHLEQSPFQTRMRFSLIDADKSDAGRIKGTYGVISGAGSFLVGAVEPGDMMFEDFGYAFEELILFATSLGLGTCWIGGTFSRSLFGEKMGLRPGEIIPAVTPVGYRAHRRSLVDSLFFLSAGSRNRRPWTELFFDNDFSTPLTQKRSGEYATTLEMVRLAPSAVNKQPWRIVRKDGRFHFFICRSPGYRSLFSAVDLQRIDLGIAMFHFHSCARESGLEGSWEIVDPGITSVLPPSTGYCASWIPHP